MLQIFLAEYSGQTAILSVRLEIIPTLQVLKCMKQFINEREITPVIDHVSPFEDAVKAYEQLARGASRKVVVKVGK